MTGPGLRTRMLLPLARWLQRARLPARRSALAVPGLALTAPQARTDGLAEVAIHLAGLMPGVAVVDATPRPDRGGRRIDMHRDQAAQVGALALQIAVFAPVWQGGDALVCAQAAVADGARALLVIESGRYSPLAVDHRLWLSGRAGWGNALPRPAGPLDLAPDPVPDDALLHLTPHPPAGWPPDRAAFGAGLLPVPTGMAWPGLRVLAFAADPALFVALRAAGAQIVAARQLDRPGSALLTRLALEARALGAQLVTSEAEALFLPQALRPQVLTLPLRLNPVDPAALAAWVGAVAQSQG